MNKVFKIGDKVTVNTDADSWLDSDDELNKRVLTIIAHNGLNYSDNLQFDTIALTHVEPWPDDFDLVEETNSIQSSGSLNGEPVWKLDKGGVTTTGFKLGVIGEETSESIIPIKRHDDIVDSARFALAGQGLGVYRPNLEDRKIGKVGMHMVDDGFPNALREVAKVMDWAAEVKGYKLHDWKNLPNAEIAFPSAGYRHRNDNSIQKALGLSASERVDHESALLHKAHEAFNVLAELELILTGVIK